MSRMYRALVGGDAWCPTCGWTYVHVGESHCFGWDGCHATLTDAEYDRHVHPAPATAARVADVLETL